MSLVGFFLGLCNGYSGLVRLNNVRKYQNHWLSPFQSAHKGREALSTFIPGPLAKLTKNAGFRTTAFRAGTAVNGKVKRAAGSPERDRLYEGRLQPPAKPVLDWKKESWEAGGQPEGSTEDPEEPAREKPACEYQPHCQSLRKWHILSFKLHQHLTVKSGHPSAWLLTHLFVVVYFYVLHSWSPWWVLPETRCWLGDDTCRAKSTCCSPNCCCWCRGVRVSGRHLPTAAGSAHKFFSSWPFHKH